jgi:hypothetical protein
LKVENTITYTTHPDLTLELVENLQIKWIDKVSAWMVKGLKKPFKSHDNVDCPLIMCEHEEQCNLIFDKYVTDIGSLKKF